MKRKLLSLLFIVIALSLVITGCGKKAKEEKKKTIPYEDDGVALIWEVKSETSTIYLVGSIHVGTEDMYPLKQVLLDAFENSDALAVEADIIAFETDLELMTELSYMMLYTDGTTIKDHLSEETYNLLMDYINTVGISGVPKTYAEHYLPIILSSAIDQQYYADSEYKSEYGVDVYFLKQAKEKGMPIIEIESVMKQYEIFVGLSDRLQDLVLKSTLETTKSEATTAVELMLTAWLRGDSEEFGKFLELQDSLSMSAMTFEEKILYEEYNRKLLDNRNIGMADKVEELLKGDQNIFYMVGSAHMFGDTGIIKLLESRGYTVTNIVEDK